MRNFRNFEHIAGYHKEKAELLTLRDLLENVEDFRSSGIRMPRGVLLYGAPGVGKTVMAKAVATGDIACVELRSADCTKSDSEEYVLAAFEEAREKAPCVLLIDELDKIAESNEAFYMEGNDRVMKVLLQELDGQKDNSGVMVIATCNDHRHLNKALLRSGRFDRIIKIGEPSFEDRCEIIKHYLDKISIEKNVDVKYLAGITSGYTGAQLECIINEAGITAIQNNCKRIEMRDVQKAMNRIAFQALEGEIKDESERFKTAVHEAGHAVIALLTDPDSISSASIIPHGAVKGHVRMMHEQESDESIEEVEAHVDAAFGGTVAEEIVLGKRYMSSMNDIGKARLLLYDLVAGIGAYGIGVAGISSDMYQHRISSVNSLKRIDTVLNAKMQEHYDKVKRIIEENRALTEHVARILVEKLTLSKEELISLYESFCGEEKTA